MPHNVIYSGQFLAAALLASVLSVAVLSGLFFYLKHHTRRDYFMIWGVAWMFYGLWVVLRLMGFDAPLTGWALIVGQWYVGTSAVFLLWGALRYMGQPTPQRSMALFLAFIYSWAYASGGLLMDRFWQELPVFALAALASFAAAAGFYGSRAGEHSTGASLLVAGFCGWGVFLVSWPFVEVYPAWHSVSVFLSSALQLFIGVSMIVLMLEEARASRERMTEEIQAVRSEKESLQGRMQSAEAEFRNLFGAGEVCGDLKSACAQLRQTQQNLVQQERLRAMGQMASGVAHDINNSLTPIIGYSDFLLESQATAPDELKKSLTYIRSAAGDIARMVEQVRQFYRRRDEDEPLQAVDLNRVAAEVIAASSLQCTDQKGRTCIRVETEFQPDLPRVHESEIEVREALTHLVRNAIEAMPQGGIIRIVTRLISPPTSAESLAGMERVVLEVCDSGIGMDEPTRQRCLEPFFTTKGPRASGLGLALVFGLMRRHQGSIEIESAPGQGTTVRLVFNPGQGARPEVEEDLTTIALPPLRILCIDDDRRVGTMLQQVLASQNHLVQVAEGGEKGLEAFRAARGQGTPFQVVITDLAMPIVDGRQIVQIVKRESPETPVILLTGWGAMMDLEGALPVNADAVVSKPPRLSELYQVLATVTKPCVA